MIAKLANYFRETARKIHSKFSGQQKEEKPEVIKPVLPILLPGVSYGDVIKHIQNQMALCCMIPLEKLFKKGKQPNQRKRAKAKARQLIRRGQYNRVKRTISI